MVKKLLGVADIAARCDVEPKTVSIWRQRYADFPEPDVTVGETAGWDPGREEEIRTWMSRRPGRGRKTVPAPHVQEALRRVFVYDSCARTTLPGRLSTSRASNTTTMACSATACRPRRPGTSSTPSASKATTLGFDDPATDPTAVLHHILWEKWTEDEIGEHQFIGRLFNERGEIYHGCTAFDAATYTLQRLAALDGEIRSRADLPVPLPSWTGQPPEEAGPLLGVIEHLRARRSYVDTTIQDMAAAANVNSILERQASTMEAMLASFKQPRPTVLLPDFTGDDYSALETTVLALIPTGPERLADIEQAVEAANADPENRKLLARDTDRLPSRTQLAGLTPWAVFVMVSLEVLKVAPEINSNDIGVLTMIVMVVLYLLPPRAGS